MKLIFEEEFTLEVGEDKYTGTIRDLTKKERAENKKKQDKPLSLIAKANKLATSIERLEKRIEIKEKLGEWSESEKLLIQIEKKKDDLEKSNIELEGNNFSDEIFKDRLEVSLSGDDKQKILDIGEEYGYQLVFETIQKDIIEKKK